MIAGHLQEKNGLFYIVLSFKDENGKRKTPWIATNLPIKGNKKRAEALLLEARQNFIIPATHEPPQKQDEADDVLFTDFLEAWLRVAKNTVKLTTYASYVGLINSAIAPYFKSRGIMLRGLTPQHIQDFYTDRLEYVSASTVIHYHAIIHRALKYAVKMELIPMNPSDRVERPKKNKFIGSFYSSDEVNQLFQICEGHPLEVPIKIGAFYGLRRSEILGLKWNAIDFDANTITIQHTVTTCNLDGKSIEVVSDSAKSEASMRTLPLVAEFRELLLRERVEQENNRRLCGRSYCTEHLGYICVNPLGERLKPNYVSNGFRTLLEKNNLRVIRFHDLRHSCASLLLANRVPMKQIQEWLGHSDFSTTANIYAHLDYQAKISSAEALISGLGRNVQKEEVA